MCLNGNQTLVILVGNLNLFWFNTTVILVGNLNLFSFNTTVPGENKYEIKIFVGNLKELFPAKFPMADISKMGLFILKMYFCVCFFF